MVVRNTGLETMIGKNSYVVDFKRKVAAALKLKKPDIDGTIEQVSSYQISRAKASKSFTSDKVLANVQSELTHSRLKNQAFRSNIIARKNELDVLFSTLDKDYRIIKKYLTAKFAPNFKQFGITTKTERDAWVDGYFIDAIMFMNRLDVAIEVCETVIEDIDSQGFAIKDTVSILNIEYRSKYEA